MKIGKKLLIWFLFLALLPLCLFAFITYHYSVETIKLEVTNNLISTADSKIVQLRSYFNEREMDITTFAQDPTIIDSMERYKRVLKNKGDLPALDKEYKSFLRYYQETHGYYDLFLISPEGDIVFSVMRENDFGTNLVAGPYRETGLAKVFDNARTILETRASDFEYYAPSDEPAAFFAAPILKNENIIGVLAYQISNDEIYKLIQNNAGLGMSGETVVASKVDNEAVFMAPLRHDTEAAFNRKIVFGSKEGIPIQEALKGIKGFGLSTDYRGKETLAVWRYFPLLRWGVVVKIDTDEAFAPAFRLRNWSLLIGFITVFIVIFIAFYISKTISNPIQILHRGTEIIRKGRLGYKVATTSTDEIGDLSRSFDKMVAEIANVNQELKQKARVVDTTNRLFDLALRCETVEELAEKTLNLAEEVTSSKFGFLGEINEKTGLFDTFAISNPGWDACNMSQDEARKSIVNMPLRGIDRGTMADGKSRIVNDPDNHPEKKGAPKGHPKINSFLGVPFLEDGKVVGMVGLANKDGDYVVDDQEAIEALSKAFINVIRRKKADILVRKAKDNLEDEVKKRTLELQRSNQELNDFAYVVSHDLKAPLRGISSLASWIFEDYEDKLDEEGKDNLVLLQKRTARMQSLIEGILEYSRIGRIKEEDEEVDLNLLLSEIVDILDPPKSIKIEVQEGLPKLKAEKTRIEQLFQNLISNSIKYIDKKEGIISIGAISVDNSWQFCVSDNGPGIDEKYFEKIFQLFQTLQSQDSFESTGVGLALVKKIVKMYGGKIWVKSEIGEGSEFYFTFPM